MPYTAWQAFIEGADGLPVSGASIEVRLESSGALATIYSDKDGAGLANPFTTGSDGLARFYAAGGFYKITATSGAFSATFRFVPVGQAAGYDVGTASGQIPLIVDETIIVGANGSYFGTSDLGLINGSGDYLSAFITDGEAYLAYENNATPQQTGYIRISHSYAKIELSGSSSGSGDVVDIGRTSGAIKTISSSGVETNALEYTTSGVKPTISLRLPIYANLAAINSAITSPEEGMMVRVTGQGNATYLGGTWVKCTDETTAIT